ncbi:MAG: GIY-YIG nuclease family protein [Candidatus Margulisbacteria bacterium]|nr:GIY-YIG nuclease family protein [Candidatus Margulisiibacteriota bacterium]
MKYTTYVLQSLYNNKMYIGQTMNLEKRFILHNTGKVKSTKSYLPWRIIFSFAFDSRSMAMELEKKLKNLKSKDRLLAYIKKL